MFVALKLHRAVEELHFKYYIKLVENPCSISTTRGVGSGDKRSNCPPPFFSIDKEQSLQLTCVDLSPWSFKLDFVSHRQEARP